MKTRDLIIVLCVLFFVLGLSYYLYLSAQWKEVPVVEPPKAEQQPVENPVELPSPPPAPQAEVTEAMNEIIDIQNYRFVPTEVYIPVGTKVTWINKDANAPHTIVAFDRSFYGTRMEPGGTYEFTFNKIGDYKYFDGIFPKSGRGTIHVMEKDQGISAVTGNAIGPNLEEGWITVSAWLVILTLFMFAYLLIKK